MAIVGLDGTQLGVATDNTGALLAVLKEYMAASPGKSMEAVCTEQQMRLEFWQKVREKGGVFTAIECNTRVW